MRNELTRQTNSDGVPTYQKMKSEQILDVERPHFRLDSPKFGALRFYTGYYSSWQPETYFYSSPL